LGPSQPTQLPHGPAPSAAPGMLEGELNWISEEEKQQIDKVRAALAGKLPDGCPEDFVHDLSIARFLRGNGNDPEVAAELYRRALEYRHGLAATSPFKEFREQFAGEVRMDLSALPNAGQILRSFPMRAVEGDSVDGLPVLFTVPRLLDVEGLEAISDEALECFIRTQLEQRWLVLHNLSLQQRRMVKFVEVRDLNGASITSLALNAPRLVSRFMAILSPLQDFYPEVVHQVLVLNAPSTFSALFDTITPFLNARMLSKVKIHPAGLAFGQLAGMLSARAIWSWVSQSAPHLDLGRLVVECGAQEYAARWLDKQQTIAWSVVLQDGSDVLFRRAFLPAPAAGKVPEPLCNEEQLAHKRPSEGTFTPEVPGVLVFCVDNTSAWWSSKTCSLRIS